MDSNIIGNNSTGITVATDTFMAIYAAGGGSSSTQSAAGLNVMPVAGTLKNFYLSCDAGPGAGITRTFWINKNGTNTGITVALTGAGTGAGVSSGSDLVDTVNFVAGDLISLHTTATATTTSTGTMRWSLDASTSANTSMVLGNSGANLSTTGSSFVCVSGKGIDTALGTNVQGILPTSGTFKNAYMILSGSAGASASYTAVLFQNGSPTSITMTVSGASATTANDTTHSVTVAPGDTLYWGITISGTPTARIVSISAEFDPTINGESIHMYGSNVALTNSANRFTAVTSPNLASYQSTETARQDLSQSAVWKKLYVTLAASPGAGTSYQTKFSLGGTPGSPSVTISNANTAGNDLSGQALATANQTVAMEILPTGTPTATTISWGIVSYMQPASSNTGSGFLGFM